jgi:[ribosomal protein S5]-alanine N-acetyltransferase
MTGLLPRQVDTPRLRLRGPVASDAAHIYRVHAACDVENIASQRALEKASFVREGRLERFTVHPNISPEPRPCFMYAKCR